MIVSALSLRTSSGFSEMNMRAVLNVLPPVKPVTLSIDGSFWMMSIMRRSTPSIAAKDVSWSA